MDDEERVFRKLARQPISVASSVVHTLWTNYTKADRMRLWNNTEFMDELLAPVGWTFLEYKKEAGMIK